MDDMNQKGLRTAGNNINVPGIAPVKQLEAPLCNVPYSTFPLAFAFGSGVWSLERNDVLLNAAGLGQDGAEMGIKGALAEEHTSLVKDGFVSKVAGFVLTGFGFQLIGLPYTVVGGNTSGSGSARVVTTGGTFSNDVRNLASAFLHSAFDNATLSFFVEQGNGRECIELIGKPEMFPSGVGYNEEPGLGVPVIGERRALRRPIAIPAGLHDADRRLIRLSFGDAHSVEANPESAVRSTGDIVAVTMRVYFHGYYATVDEMGQTDAMPREDEDHKLAQELGQTALA